MENTTTSSLLLGHIADCAKAVPKLGMNHVQVADGLLKASNFHTQIYVNVNIASLDHKEEEKRLDLSVEASPRNIALLRSVGKTTNPGEDIKAICVTISGKSYSFVDNHRKTEISKIAIKPTTATISEFIKKGQTMGTAIPPLTGKEELSLKGNEASVFLCVYGEQLSSVIAPGQPEHFFVADTARQMRRKERTLYRSNGFLKFGEPEFALTLHAVQGGVWLLAEGTFADVIPYQVLEKLTKII